MEEVKGRSEVWGEFGSNEDFGVSGGARKARKLFWAF